MQVVDAARRADAAQMKSATGGAVAALCCCTVPAVRSGGRNSALVTREELLIDIAVGAARLPAELLERRLEDSAGRQHA
jgi:hypothetical protein